MKDLRSKCHVAILYKMLSSKMWDLVKTKRFISMGCSLEKIVLFKVSVLLWYRIFLNLILIPWDAVHLNAWKQEVFEGSIEKQVR